MVEDKVVEEGGAGERTSMSFKAAMMSDGRMKVASEMRRTVMACLAGHERMYHAIVPDQKER